MTNLKPHNEDHRDQSSQNRPKPNANKRLLMPVIKLSEVPTYPDSLTPVRPGASSVVLIRQHLQMTPQHPLVIYEASPVPLNRPEDIPYLEQEIHDLEDFLNDASNGSVALRKVVNVFLQ